MSRGPVLNPWGLSCAEVDVMDALCAHGDQESAGKKLNVKATTIRHHLRLIRKKMLVASSLRAAVVFDRWRQGVGRGVPA